MQSKLFETALERAAKTWQTYTKVLCTLHLAFIIDALGGYLFLQGKSIDFVGFTVVRESLSATYGILFSLFVATTFIESRLLKTCVSSNNSLMPDELPVIHLWFLSPFSELSFMRKVFWFLYIDGFHFLALFSFAHLAIFISPDCVQSFLKIDLIKLPDDIYVGIGVIDLVLFIICVPFGYLTYRNFQSVRAALYDRS
ncbi:MAG: hypothetical protein FDX21_00430 [Chlorobium sp.]|nr:MAG: hypothetical protein FDX21_00430 [Chlorobium sp.]